MDASRWSLRPMRHAPVAPPPLLARPPGGEPLLPCRSRRWCYGGDMGARQRDLAGEPPPREGERGSIYCPRCARHTLHDAVFLEIRVMGPHVRYFAGWRCGECGTLHSESWVT